MEKDLENKKFNNEQKVNEGFSEGHLPEDYNPGPAKLRQELETDTHGDKDVVARARHNDPGTQPTETGLDDNPTRKAVENRDRNSDIATNRYPAEHPENHRNRGNMELDE